MILVFNIGEWCIKWSNAIYSTYLGIISNSLLMLDVTHREPAKFAATLRHANPESKNPVCLKLDMSAGHFSASDRYKYLKELSIDYSFLLDQLGLAEQP